MKKTFSHFLFLLFIVGSTLSFAHQQLIIEPDMGREPIINAIQNAHSRVQLVMYGLTDQAILSSLIYANNTGKKLSVLLEPQPYKQESENYLAMRLLQPIKVLQFSGRDYKLTHQKALIIDDKKAYILTFNFTHSTFEKERNFGLITDDPGIINEMEKVFSADWQHHPISVNHPQLIWSPNNSREKIIGELNKAKSEIKIYAQSLSDYKIVGALAHAAHNGLKVQVLMSIENEHDSKKYDYLRKAGVILRFSKQYMIHAKVIIIDNKEAILGSTNLTKNSLDNNRELSIITFDSSVVGQLSNTFDNDWRATSLSGTVFPELLGSLMPQIKKWLRHTLHQII